MKKMKRKYKRKKKMKCNEEKKPLYQEMINYCNHFFGVA